jgi:RNA polymerase sigma-70 factor (ECF subfamily)
MSALQHSLFSSQPVRRPRHLCVDRFDVSASTRSSSEKKIIPEEWALIQQAIDGDSAAAEQIFGCHATMLYRIAFRILHNKEDAEDAVQDSFGKAYAKLQSFQGRASFSTWLTRIVINSALMVRRRRNGRPETPLEEILDARPHRLQREIVDAAFNPEQICSGTEIHQLLEKQLSQLPTGLRAAFQLRELDGLSASDSCRVLGIRKNAFKSRISRARHKLRRALQKSLHIKRETLNSTAAVHSFMI